MRYRHCSTVSLRLYSSTVFRAEMATEYLGKIDWSEGDVTGVSSLRERVHRPASSPEIRHPTEQADWCTAFLCVCAGILNFWIACDR